MKKFNFIKHNDSNKYTHFLGTGGSGGSVYKALIKYKNKDFIVAAKIY